MSRGEITKRCELRNIAEAKIRAFYGRFSQIARIYGRARIYTGGFSALKEARLDYFLVDTDLASFVELVGVAHHFTSQCDHRPVTMNIDYVKVRRGPGYWKFNNLLLEDLDFTSKVRNTS